MAQREAALKRRIVAALRTACPGSWWCCPHGGCYGRAGVPDILGCVDGRFVAIEVKTGAGTTTARQDREIAAIVRAGGLASVARSAADALYSVRPMKPGEPGEDDA